MQRYEIEITQAADPGAVYALNQALVQVMERGTGRTVRRQLPEDLIVAGKTGTSDDLRDSWFAGFTNDHLIVTWLGADDNRPIGLTGSTGAAKIWAGVLVLARSELLQRAAARGRRRALDRLPDRRPDGRALPRRDSRFRCPIPTTIRARSAATAKPASARAFALGSAAASNDPNDRAAARARRAARLFGIRRGVHES